MPKEMTAAAILLSAVVAGVPQIKPDAGERIGARISVIDPCDVASAAELKTVLSVGLARTFRANGARTAKPSPSRTPSSRK